MTYLYYILYWKLHSLGPGDLPRGDEANLEIWGGANFRSVNGGRGYLLGSQRQGYPSKLHWEVSGWSGKFPDNLESFRIFSKVSGQSGKFRDNLEDFQITWKVPDSREIFGWPGKFPDGLESFWVVWKVSEWSGKLPDNLEGFRIISKVSR